MSGPPQPKVFREKRAPKPMQRKPMKRTKSKSKAEFHPSVRAEVERRSGGKCEAQTGQCTHRATILHHRRRRSQGGSGDADNALYVCNPCHLYIHANIEESARNGWLVIARCAM